MFASHITGKRCKMPRRSREDISDEVTKYICNTRIKAGCSVHQYWPLSAKSHYCTSWKEVQRQCPVYAAVLRYCTFLRHQAVHVTHHVLQTRTKGEAATAAAATAAALFCLLLWRDTSTNKANQRYAFVTGNKSLLGNYQPITPFSIIAAIRE